MIGSPLFLNSYSSSFLDMLPAHLQAAPYSSYSAREPVTKRRLDSIIDEYCSVQQGVYLKLDVQGFERHVIEGAMQTLPRIAIIQAEMSLTPLYAGEPTFHALHNLIESNGFRLFSMEPAFANKETGQLLQVDGIYRRI